MGRDDRLDAPSGTLPESLNHPQVSLIGDLDAERAGRLIEQLHEAEKQEGDIVVEVTTLGGDAELARRIVLEIGLIRERTGRRLLFLGKTAVYSAGTTIMSAFPREDRYLTEDTVLLIHCRQLDKTVEISGPIRASLPQIKALSAQVENGVAIEERNFRRLIEGSDIELEELFEKALCNWYIHAPEALRLGLVAGLTGSNIP
jgi:ATP-dependent Clp protease, protease subunit